MPLRRRSWAEPYKIKMVEPIKMTTPADRIAAIESLRVRRRSLRLQRHDRLFRHGAQRHLQKRGGVRRLRLRLQDGLRSAGLTSRFEGTIRGASGRFERPKPLKHSRHVSRCGIPHGRHVRPAPDRSTALAHEPQRLNRNPGHAYAVGARLSCSLFSARKTNVS